MLTGVKIRAKRPSGSWATVDVSELDDESFRRFVMLRMVMAGLVHGMNDEVEAAKAEPLRAKAREN